MNGASFLFTCLLPAVLLPASRGAQQSGKVPRIGYVDSGSTSTTGHRAKAFVQGLRDLGYIERENILIEYRWAEGKLERLSGLVQDVVRLKVKSLPSPTIPFFEMPS